MKMRDTYQVQISRVTVPSSKLNSHLYCEWVEGLNPASACGAGNTTSGWPLCTYSLRCCSSSRLEQHK